MNYNKLLIKDNRFKLNNYKKNDNFDKKIKKWHNKMKGIRFSKHNEIYKLPYIENIKNEDLWWQKSDYDKFIKRYYYTHRHLK